MSERQGSKEAAGLFRSIVDASVRFLAGLGMDYFDGISWFGFRRLEEGLRIRKGFRMRMGLKPLLRQTQCEVSVAICCFFILIQAWLDLETRSGCCSSIWGLGLVLVSIS